MFTSHNPAREQYTDEQLLDALRDVARRSGTQTVGRRHYKQFAPVDAPTADIIEFRFGAWGCALIAAGLTPTDQPVQLQGTTRTFTENELLSALHRYVTATGLTSLRGYKAWRAALLRESTTSVDLPSAEAIKYRFGQWSIAIDHL